MEKPYFKFPDFIPRILLVSITIVTIIIVHSCRKENSKSETVSPVSLAKTWYESAYPVSSSGNSKLLTQSIGGVHDLSQLAKPDWLHTASYKRFNKDVIEMPVDPAAKFGSDLKIGNKQSNKAYTRSFFLMLNDGQKYEAYMMTIIADSDYVKNDLSKLAHNTYRKHDADFSGKVLYFTPKGQYLNGYTYQNGQLVTATSSAQQTGNQVVQSVNDGKLKTDDMAVQCTDWYLDFYIDGQFWYSSYFGTTCTGISGGVSTGGGGGGGSSGGGGGTGSAGSVPPPPPCAPSAPIESSVTGGHLTINNLPTPPDGGYPPPVNSPCPPVVKTDSIPAAAEPCAQKVGVIARATNTIIAAQNATILGDSTSTNEYGADQNLTSITGSTYKNTPVTSGTGNTWNPTFTWDSTAGYTVGWTHDHPFGSAPSPDDVFVMMTNLTNPALISAGAQSIKVYKSNVSVTVVTKTGNYVVTVKDWGALQTLYTDFNSTQEDPTTHLNAFDTDFVSKGRTYLTANPLASEGDAGIYALQTKFGASINIFHAPKGSTTYTPLTVTTVDSKPQVATLPCLQ